MKKSIQKMGLLALLVSLTFFTSCKKSDESGTGVEPCDGCGGMPPFLTIKCSKSGFLKDRGLEVNQYKYTDFEFYTMDKEGQKEVHKFRFNNQVGSDIASPLEFSDDPDLKIEMQNVRQWVDKGPIKLYMVTNKKTDTLDLEYKSHGYRAVNVSFNGKLIADTLSNPVEIVLK